MKTYLIKVLLLQILCIQFNKTLFRSKYNKMLNKAKDYYKTTFGKDKSWHFLGHDLSEYPGTDDKYRRINQEKWNKYYECLKVQNEMLGEERSMTPDAIQAFEGGSVSLQCKVCLNPKEQRKIDAVEWFWGPLDSKHLTVVEYTVHILLSPIDKTLHLYNLGTGQTGQYLCRLGTSLIAPYFLTVVNNSINASEVHSTFAKQGPFPRSSVYIVENNLMLSTEWGDWSPCSRCDKAGKRHKFGYCTVSRANIKETNETDQLMRAIRSKKKYKSKIIESTDLEIFNIMKEGIPCMSHILPESIKNLPQIKERTIEIMTGYCRVKCQEEAVFEVKDKNGNIIEKANNSAGIYSMMQGLPPVEPAVTRSVQYEGTDQHIAISCPGNLNSDAPIQWQLGGKKLIPELIAEQSRGRIYITVMDKINIKKTKITDSGTYSCWQNDELAGTVRLAVEKRIKMTFNHHIMLFGMVVILSIFLYVFTKAFFGRQYARIIK